MIENTEVYEVDKVNPIKSSNTDQPDEYESIIE